MFIDTLNGERIPIIANNNPHCARFSFQFQLYFDAFYFPCLTDEFGLIMLNFSNYNMPKTTDNTPKSNVLS